VTTPTSYTRTITHTDIYGNRYTLSFLEKIVAADNKKIVDFRPPVAGEDFLSDLWFGVKATHNFKPDQPRFILAPALPTFRLKFLRFDNNINPGETTVDARGRAFTWPSAGVTLSEKQGVYTLEKEV
jgi:hypothetical protein